jgi:tetratricopeptide (TPR) repeat protein
MCNLLAMTYLQQEDFAMVLELLKKAEILTERDDPGKAVTLNNLACYYRRQGKLHAALQYLHRALKIEARLGSKVCVSARSSKCVKMTCVVFIAKLFVLVDNVLCGAIVCSCASTHVKACMLILAFCERCSFIAQVMCCKNSCHTTCS